jgi:membrane protein DedA with SNARE-associated domain
MSIEHRKNNPGNSHYLGLSFQMAIFILLGVFAGMKLDEKTGARYIFTILFSLLAVALSLYYIIHKETYKKKKDE